MSTLPKTYLTPEEYLEIERKAEYKSEYCQGKMFAMAGARWVHTLIVGHLVGQLEQQLRGRCHVSANDLRVGVSPAGIYTYPDVVVVCGPPKFLDGQLDTLLNPILIAEVLSPSTEAYDRGYKFEQYKLIESFRDYLLVSSDRVRAELYTRQADGQWPLTAANELKDTLELASVGCTLRVSDLYDKVEL